MRLIVWLHRPVLLEHAVGLELDGHPQVDRPVRPTRGQIGETELKRRSCLEAKRLQKRKKPLSRLVLYTNGREPRRPRRHLRLQVELALARRGRHGGVVAA
eukprot:1874408-Prymnesium_polylepis.1